MLKLFEKIKEDFGMIATLLGFIVDSLAIIALVSQGATPSIPALGSSAQMSIWALALFSYLGFLRDYWRKSLKQNREESYDHRFEYFLFYELPRLKNPYALLGFVFLFFMLTWIVGNVPEKSQLDTWTGCFFSLIALLVIFGMFSFKRNEEEQAEKEWDYLSNEDNIKLWYSRIGKEFKQNGYVVDYDLAALYSTSQSLIYKIMRRFVDQYGVDYGIYLITDTVSKRVPSPTDPKQMVTDYRYPSTLTRKTLIDWKPWLDNWERFFNF